MGIQRGIKLREVGSERIKLMIVVRMVKIKRKL